MDRTIKEQLEKMENHLNEALDNDLLNDPGFDMDDFQSEVCSFERELNEILEFNREHLQFPELEKICHIQKLIKLAKDEYDFYGSPAKACGLGIDFSKPKQEEFPVYDASELRSELFDFSIERFCRSIGRTVDKIV